MATDATDDEPGCGGSRCDRRATLSSASSSRPPAAPGRGTAADGIAWTGACARPSSTAASRQPETGARLVVWNERRVSDRKHSDSGLQQRANAATFQRDRNTWELVGCVQSKRDAPEQQQQQRQTEFGGATAFPVNPPIVGRMDWDDCRDADLVWIRRTPKMTRGHMPPSVLTAVLSRQHADDERGHRGCDGQQQDHVAIHRDIMSTRSHGLQRRQ